MAAPGKEDSRCVVGQHGPQEASGFGEGGGEALEGRRAALEVPEQVEAAPGPRPPTVVLVGHVVVAAGHALGEQDRVEIQQRPSHRQTPLERTRLHVGVFRRQRLGACNGPVHTEAAHVHAGFRELSGQAAAPRQDLARALRPVDGRLGAAVRTPARRAALARGAVEREVDVRRCLAEDLHLVQVQELHARQLEAHEAPLSALERHGQGLVVRESIEGRAVVRVDRPPGFPVVGEQKAQAVTADGHAVAAVPDRHTAERNGLAEVHLPPRIFLEIRVKGPATVLHTVTTAGRVGLDRDRCRPAQAADPLLQQPVGLDLAAEVLRGRGGTCAGQQADGHQRQVTQAVRWQLHGVHVRQAVRRRWIMPRVTARGEGAGRGCAAPAGHRGAGIESCLGCGTGRSSSPRISASRACALALVGWASRTSTQMASALA